MAVNPGLLYPPIELAHVASVLEADGHEVAMVVNSASLSPMVKLQRLMKEDVKDAYGDFLTIAAKSHTRRELTSYLSGRRPRSV